MPLKDDYISLGMPEVAADFFARHRRLMGIAIAFDHNNHRLWWDGIVFSSDGDGGGFTLYPKLYSSLKTAARSLLKVRTTWPEAKIGLWLAPEHEWHSIPLKKYIQMSGNLFPGCPTK